MLPRGGACPSASAFRSSVAPTLSRGAAGLFVTEPRAVTAVTAKPLPRSSASWTPTAPPEAALPRGDGGGPWPQSGAGTKRRLPAARRPRAAAPKAERPPPQFGARRARAQRRQRQEASRGAPPAGQTRLQQRSVTALTLAKYELAWRRFLEWRRLACAPEAVQLRGREARGATFEDHLDDWLALWMDEEFLNGEQAYVGSQMMAVAKFHLPAFGKSGGRSLPRAGQSLRGWRRLAPGRARLPLPWEAVALLAEQLVLDGYWTTAVLVVLSFHCYFRPSGGFKLKREMMVPPLRGSRYGNWSLVLHPFEFTVASKTHQFDETVVVDAPDFKLLLDPALAWLRACTPPQQCPFAFSQADFIQRFRLAGQRCGIELLRPELYMLRHSGPSFDQAIGRRTLAEIKLRGRWMSDAAVQRYRKEGRVSEQLRRLPAPVLAKAMGAPARLRTLLGRPSNASFPPTAGRGSDRRSF
ncbi:unnamed protein product [Prorocentrum cordatum]|uniref:Tyr recombinase domain-containing protein n=1 Tax=Prorocentrum cordatum TaxID=2364126 RepID=A0ABN9XXA0_9DINO|nr:unnamed protein product [Polarella glacialis]